MLGSANGEKGLSLFLGACFGEKVVRDVLQIKSVKYLCTVNIFLPSSPGSRGKLEGHNKTHWTCDVPFVSHKQHRGVMVDSHQQCGEFKPSTSNIFPREDSSLALKSVPLGLHKIQGPLDAVFYAALALGHYCPILALNKCSLCH